MRAPAALLALALALPATAQQIDNATFVTVCYLTYLHRVPSSSEVAWYVNQLQSGTVTQATVVAYFLGSPEYASWQKSIAQVSGFGVGPIWVAVAECHQNEQENCVGLEIAGKRSADPSGVVVGVDVTDYGGMTAAYQCPADVPCLVSPSDPTSYILFPSSGGVQIWAHGKLVQSY